MQDRAAMKNTVQSSDAGKGVRARKMAEGKCVPTIVLIMPKRLDSADEQMTGMMETMRVAEMIEPSLPCVIVNFRSMYDVTRDLSRLLARIIV